MKTTILLTGPMQGSPQFYEKMGSFLLEHHPFRWRSESLQYSWVFEICLPDTDEPLAYIWLNYAQVEPELILEFHACIPEKYQRRLWSKTMIYTIADTIVEESTCMRYIAQCHNDGLRKLWRFMGWEVGHLMATYTVPDKEIGDG